MNKLEQFYNQGGSVIHMKKLGTKIKWRLRGAAYKARERWFTPLDMEDSFVSGRSAYSEFTLTSTERQYALWNAVNYIEAAKIEGDIVECGVWKGGSMMLVARTLAGLGSLERGLWLYDTFVGASEPSGDRDFDRDGVPIQKTWDSRPAYESSLQMVQRNMASMKYPEDKINYVQGKVEETMPERVPSSIALLRLDTDWYESTRHEIENLWPLLSPGGVLFVDDYGHYKGARDAIDEYFASRGDLPLLNRVDYSGRVAIKR